MTSHTPFPLRQYLFAVLGILIMGILISIVLPVVRKVLPKAFGLTLAPASAVATSMETYLVVGVFSLLTAVLIIAFGGAATASWEWYIALLAGYVWDSTLQKIVLG